MRVNGNVQNITINASSDFTGQVHAVGSLLGTLEINDGSVSGIGPDAAILIDQDVIGDVVLHYGLGRDLVVNGTASGDIELAGIAANVNIGHGLTGTLTGTFLGGGILVAGDAEEGLTGALTLTGGVYEWAAIEITGGAGLSGSLAVDNVVGMVHVAHDVSGGLSIAGALAPEGLVQIDGSMSGSGHVTVGTDLQGRLEARADVTSTSSRPTISVGQNLTGQIRLYGPLNADPNEDDVIQIGGAMPFPGAFTVDFDGYDEDDDWDSGAYVLVEQSDPNDPNSGPASYNGNSPAVRVYRVTSCLGDMQNDASVNTYDVTYFVAAQTGPDQYAAIAPGLEGSMVYHCDVNEDGTCDFGDINCFVYLVTNEICGPCPGEDDRGEPPSPQELAAQLADNVWPELYDDLVWVVGQAIDWQKTQKLREYWTAVYDALTE